MSGGLHPAVEQAVRGHHVWLMPLGEECEPCRWIVVVSTDADTIHAGGLAEPGKGGLALAPAEGEAWPEMKKMILASLVLSAGMHVVFVFEDLMAAKAAHAALRDAAAPTSLLRC